MLIPRPACLLVFFGFTSLVLWGCQENTSPVSATIREEAYKTLDKVLEHQEEWVKVHAAEYKIWSGYTGEVFDIYLKEAEKFGNKPPYRIGIWRVLAQSARDDSTRQEYLEKIITAFKDPDGQDRVHAAETLAKLGVPIADLAPDQVSSILEGERNSLYIYTLWASLNGAGNGERNWNPLFEYIQTETQDKLTLMQAAYALRHHGHIGTDDWTVLASLALNEPGDSMAKVYLLSAAYILADGENVNSEFLKEIRRVLLELQNAQSKGERMEMALALGEKGNMEDFPILLSLLRGDDPIVAPQESRSGAIFSPADADVRATAAYAILRMEKNRTHRLAYWDWVVVILYLVGMMVVGYAFSKKNRNEKDYLLGGGKMNPIAVGLSLFATLLSSLSYLSYPGEMIKYGPVVFSGVLAFPMIHYVVGWFLIPKFMKLKVTSAYELLEINLGLSIRMLAIFFFLSLRFLWMGTIIFITVNTAVISIFGFEGSDSNVFLISFVLIGVTIIYTTMGGLKAVVFTDVIQSVVLLGGALLTIIVVSVYYGSFSAWLPSGWLSHWGELRWGIVATERLSIGNALLMTFIWYVASSGSDQMSIQRFLATENLRSARKTFGVSLITSFVAQSLLGLVGLAVMAYFMSNPQFLAPNESVATHADVLFPRFILVGLPIGISGLVAAGILAAAMSSLSSGLNATSSVISEDLMKRFKKRPHRQTNELKRIRLLSLLVGLFTLILSLFISKVEGNLYDVIVKVVNLFVSPLFVLFFMALFIPFATARGVFIGGVGSIVMAVAVAFFKYMGIEVLFIMPAALLAGIILGMVASYVDVQLLGNRETVSNRIHKIWEDENH